ncbi:hypothetical protein KP509_02G047700 [Ceratopteris richardii]|uniref:Pentatricopeptide repeat-containing protein n=1 Tax=Ceratopteris richardii TaxID=49495 RepID=A0A8T2VD82_CERRI|nr:hypothetical protein KP509_02G047700 [Ceratopteris richardii]
MKNLTSLLKNCAYEKNLQYGRTLHAQIERRGLLQDNVFIGSALINMYTKCGAISIAREVFDTFPSKNLVLWTSMIAGYAQMGLGEEALACFDDMQANGILPDGAAYVCALTACGTIGAAEKGQEIHAQADRDGLVREDIVVGTAVVDMYAKCGMLENAQKTFDELAVQNVVSWTALITGYAQNGSGEKALYCFEQMRRDGLSPNESTFSCILKACGAVGDFWKGCEVHVEIMKAALLERDIVIANALVDMYAKCGDMVKAQTVFNELSVPDVVSWSTLISGYAQHLHYEQALCCFECMKLGGVSPNTITCVSILSACGRLGAFSKGQEIHRDVVMKAFLEKDPVVGNALVSMYATCGMLEEAQLMFDTLRVQDMVSWNELLEGCAQLGKDNDVFEFFDRMVAGENQPDLFSFTIILNSCCHKGLVEEGILYFNVISSCFNIIPDLEHCVCVLDLYGRAGNLGKAAAVSEGMPFLTNLSVWHNMLGACQKWGNIETGMWAFRNALQLDDSDPAAYVYMSNIFAVSDFADI